MAREAEQSYLDNNYDESVYWTAVPLTLSTRNCELEVKYSEKKQELRAQGRTEDEVKDQTLFCCCDKYKDVETVTSCGLQCGMKCLNSSLGNDTKGVSLGKHVDVFLRKSYDNGLQTCWIIVFKVMYGRVKGVLPIQTPPYREPALDADCHCSFISASVDDSLHLQEIKSQVYLFERDAVISTSFNERPRQCVPLTVVMYNRVGCLTDAVDLRLVTDDRSHRTSKIANSQTNVSIMVGKAGRRQVVVSNLEKTFGSNSVSASNNNTTKHQQAPSRSHRTVMSCESGTITKITISNDDRKRSDDVAGTAVDGGCHSSTSTSATASTSLFTPGNTQTTTVDADPLATADSARSQYRHLIRRRKKTQPTAAAAASRLDQTETVPRVDADLSLPPPPRSDDTPLTLLQRQKTLVSDMTKQLSVELSSVTSFLRVTKPAHIDARERLAMQSMQLINAAYQRLTPACLKYRQFCAGVTTDIALPDVGSLRVHDSALRRCRAKLRATFNERRSVILQTPIAGQQRLFTFVWLQRHSAVIVDCINVVVDVLEAVLRPPANSSAHTSDPPQPAGTSNVVSHVEVTASERQYVESNTDDVEPRMNASCALDASGGLCSDECGRPPSLLPAIKTDIVETMDEPPVLQPCNFPSRVDTARPLHSHTSTAQSPHLNDQHRFSTITSTPRVNSSSPDRSVPLQAIKQEQPENVLTAQTTLLDTVSYDASDILARSQLADRFVPNGIVTDTSDEADAESQKADDYVMMRGEHVYEQIQRLLGARDQKAFSRLLIDSICSMATDEFHRVREKLIRRFIDEQGRTESDVVWLEAKVKKDENEQPQTEAEQWSDVLASEDDFSSSTSSSLPLKIVNVRSCGDDGTDDVTWPPCDVTQQSRDQICQNFPTTNYITIEPIETTKDSAPTNYDDDRPTANCTTRGDDTQCQYTENINTQPESTTCHLEPDASITSTETAQRSQADVVNATQTEARESRSDADDRQCDDAAMTSVHVITTTMRSSRRRKLQRRAAWRPPLLPTPPMPPAANVSRPWLCMPGFPQTNHSTVSPVCGPAFPPFMPQYSYPLTPQPASTRQHRPTDVGLDGGRRGDGEPVWLSETTAKQQRGSLSLQCCLAFVARCLSEAVTRQNAARVVADAAEHSERQRRVTGDDLCSDRVDVECSLSRVQDDSSRQKSAIVTTLSDHAHDHDDATPHQQQQSQLTDKHSTDHCKQRTPAAQLTSTTSSRPLVVRESKPRQREEPRPRTTRNRSDSDSSDLDSTHRPRIHDLRRTRPGTRFVPSWRGEQPMSCWGHAAVSYSWEGRRTMRQDTFLYDRRRTAASTERRWWTENFRRYSVSSERSLSASTISSSGRSNSSKEGRCKDIRSSTDSRSNETKSTKMIAQMATNNRVAINFQKASRKCHKNSNTMPEKAHKVNKVSEYNNSCVCCDASIEHSSGGYKDSTFNVRKTSDIGSTDSSSTNIRWSKNCATSDSGLKSPQPDARRRSRTPPAGNSNVSRIERQSDKGDLKRVETDSRGISPSKRKQRHSRSGSRPGSGNNRKLSTETSKSENSHFTYHDHRTKSLNDSRENEKRRTSRKQSRSRSDDRKKRSLSQHGVNSNHETKSDHERRERKRSYRQRMSRSSSRGKNFFSSSASDHSSTVKRGKKKNSEQDQLSAERRLKAERKQLEKIRKKAERALKKFEQLESKYRETDSHQHKPARTPAPTTAMSVSQDKNLLDENSNKCEWNTTEIQSNQPGCNKSLNVDAFDFIASNTSPVSSPSVLSDTETNFCNDKKLRIEKTSNDENE